MSTPTAAELRQRFLDFFQRHGHRAVDSSALVPANDPTLFFTNAGMVQFKDVFTGAEVRDYRRATTVQKCLRVSGKHNDLDNVGRTPRHHTFFEMLGNFSFGDYFKEEAIAFAWEFLTKDCGLDPERLWVTVFEEDDEAFELWSRIPDLPVERIQRMGASENFWSMGDTGPCGPCTEIHYDHGADKGPGGGPATDSPRYVEIWNLVFMQFERFADGSMTPLPSPSVDTGMGLERICAAVQGVYSNYDTDCFLPLMARAAELAGAKQGQDEDTDTALRVIADHARATAHLIADGVMPSNEERGYVLRRIMRRAIRFGVKIGLEDPFLWQVADAVVDHMGDAYPDLERRREFIREVVKGEEERFSETLDKGLKLLEQELARLQPGAALPGDVAFKLYDTYGFPDDLTGIICEERGYGVDTAGFHEAMEEQKAKGRAAWKGSGEEKVGQIWHDLHATHGDTTFLGYDHDRAFGKVLAIVSGGDLVERIGAGQSGQLLVDRTPFYGESGGQVGDRGWIRGEGLVAQVADTQKPVAGLWAHHATVQSGSIAVGDRVELEVDDARRDQIRRNHTATHLLHAALRNVLGEHVTQKGSLVDPDRLRFDFAHHKAMTVDEVQRVEDMVYSQILANRPVEAAVGTMDDARARGAMALFGEKYGDVVRTIDVPGFSLELCGGTHAGRTGDIGLFRILAESGVAAGVRRIEALTGLGALQHVRSREAATDAVAGELRTPIEQLPDAVRRIVEERKRLERELDQARTELARAQAGDLTDGAREIDGVRVVSAEFAGDPKGLRDEADRLRDSLGTSVVVLGSRAGGKVQLIVAVSKDLAGKRAHAGNLIRELAQMVGGGGGGRPDMAQAGGKDPDALPAALEQAYSLVGAQLGA
ncbi:MAG: alanine--tRNA ligase [Alphaproteobacteria bacterium]|nr:alanine--tRNA ligase [Alphaproteobacteria bacterium]